MGVNVHSADGPIVDPADDVLGRYEFACALADDVRLAPTGSGFVIGLTGPWGSGKTSVLKLASHVLQDEVSAVVSFNPWLFSGTEQLVSHFFGELSGQLGKSGGQVRRVAKAISSYGRLVSPLRYVPYVGELARVGYEASQAIGGVMQAEEQSAEVQAGKLKTMLEGLDKPILVLVDDLDRLRPEEIVDVVRLVRLVGDFPNLVYIVAFDPGVVEKALSKNGGDGRAYLEKIIHISHALPPVRHGDLSNVLQVALAEAIPNPDEFRFDEQRFGSVFWSDTRPLFATVRDVRRFTNVLRTTLDLLGDEVDLADILALEALRLLEPNAFDGMVAARYALTGARDPFGNVAAYFLQEEGNTHERELVARILDLAKQASYVERILNGLFPNAERLLGGPTLHASVASEWKAARRVADSDVFDIYLHRRLAPGALPTREVEEILRLFGDEQGLREALDELDDDKLPNLYTRLAEYQGKKSVEEVQAALEAVMARGVGFGHRFSDMSGSILVRRLLEDVPEDRIAELLRGLRYPNLSRRFDAIRAVGHRKEEQTHQLTEEDTERLLEELASDSLNSNADELSAEPDFVRLVDFLDRRDHKRFVRKLGDWASKDTFFVHLVASYMLEKTGERNVRAIRLNWFALAAVLDAAKLRDRFEQIEATWVEEEFDDDTWTLWQQALRYLRYPEEAEEDLAGWLPRRPGEGSAESS